MLERDNRLLQEHPREELQLTDEDIRVLQDISAENQQLIDEEIRNLFKGPLTSLNALGSLF